MLARQTGILTRRSLASHTSLPHLAARDMGHPLFWFRVVLICSFWP
jgi:hypothetical protein